MNKENRERIRNLFKTNKVLYFSDISEKLNIGIEEVVDICRDLHANGEIQVAPVV